MKRSSSIRFITLLILLGMLINTSYTEVIASPTLHSRIGTGLILPPSSGTTLPSSEANISIISDLNNSTSVLYNINITNSFIIHSDINQSSTVMFISPDSWIPWSDSENFEPWTTFTLSYVRTTVNSIEASNDIHTWNDLSNPPDLDEPEWEGWDGLQISKFIVFDTMLYEGHNTTVSIEIHFELVSTSQIFDFYYFVDPARSWSGNTHEKIRISVEDYASFTEYIFLPNMNLEVGINDPFIVGTWDFITNQFDGNYVDFWCVHPFEIPSYQPPPPTLMDAIILFAVPTSVIIVFVLAGGGIVRELGRT